MSSVRNPLQSLSIRWRLAGITALLTFVILCAFAVAVGTLTTQRIRSDFDSQITARAIDLRDRIAAVFDASDGVAHVYPKVGVEAYAAPEDAVIRVLARDGSVLLSTKRKPNLGPPAVGVSTVSGYRVETRSKRFELTDPVVGRFLYPVFIQYARPISAMENTISRVRLFLILGVLGGTGAALLGGLVLARRAMAPIAELTSTTREIARTRDPGLRVPQPEADDEVAELARTLDGMLQALDSARSETEAMLLRQREFVADASHELRTPLTSVLANLELLA
jgi:two-component system OmpR family sensor kinase